MLRKSESVVETANRLVKLSLVLSWEGIYVPEFDYAKSVKLRCPYADMYHLDGDAGRSMRLYPETNTGNCFMGCGTLTPVSVHAKLHDLSYKVAAHEILEKIGHKPKTFWEKWEEALTPPTVFNREAYRESLTEYCFRESRGHWNIVQYKDSVSSTFTKTLEVLDTASSDEEALEWLSKVKPLMQAAIRKELPDE